MSNLPDWPGADTCYSRAYKWTAEVSAKAYSAWSESKKARKIPFRVPEDVEAMIKALSIGDQEVIKGLNLRYIDYWMPKRAPE